MTDTTQYTAAEILAGMRGNLSQRLASLSRRALMMDRPTIEAMGDHLDRFREERRVVREGGTPASKGAPSSTTPTPADTRAHVGTPGPADTHPPADAPGAAAHRALVAERAQVDRWRAEARKHEARAKQHRARVLELEAEVARLSEQR